jgi:hypothetical protein
MSHDRHSELGIHPSAMPSRNSARDDETPAW